MKIATPESALLTGPVCRVRLPESAAPPGLLASATVIMRRGFPAVLPNASTTRTRTAGVMFVPAATVVGCTWNTSPVAAAGAMANVFEVAVARPGELACSRYPDADRSRLRF